MNFQYLNRGGRRPAAEYSLFVIALLAASTSFGQPVNDECTGATVIPSSAPVPAFYDSVDTTTATSNPADPSLLCNGNGSQTDGNTVWYVWTPSQDVTVNISTAGSTVPGGGAELDTAHGVFTGSCAALTQVECVDVDYTDDMIFEATAGETYYIKFGEYLDGAGGGNLVVTVDQPPPPQQFILESVADGVSAPISSLVAQFAATRSLESTQAMGRFEALMQETPLLMREDVKRQPRVADGPNENADGRPDQTSPQAQARLKVLQRPSGHNRDAGIELLQIFDGVENDDNLAQNGFLDRPPDTVGDVGPRHYVQMTNHVTEIFGKRGNTILGPFLSNTFWTGLDGHCNEIPRGDPIVLYDEETDRWLITKFVIFRTDSPPWSLCIAVSVSGDPTGAYYQHEFDFSGVGFPDYPKYGFASGAIAMMANIYSPYLGSGIGAIDKTEAFSASPTTMIFYTISASEFGFLPGDNDGPVFGNVPPTFFTNNGSSGDRIDVWEVVPDFESPAKTTIAEVARIRVTPFDLDLCPAFRTQCIAQPGSGTGEFPDNIPFLEAISYRLMHRAQIRSYGNTRKAVLNHTVDADGEGTAGIRWYELQNRKGQGWTLVSEDTLSPDSNHRWMGSIAMSVNGDICLGYSISSQTTFPSIGVACRKTSAKPGDPLRERIVFDGNALGNVQRQTARWGDYSAMSTDPERNTFWYTQQFADPNVSVPPEINPERLGWGTKVMEIDVRGGGSDRE